MSAALEALLSQIEVERTDAPVDEFRWRASIKDYSDERGPFGHGPTQDAAIQDLIETYEAEQDRLASRKEAQQLADGYSAAMENVR